jgi:hypothetical protein
VAILVVAATHAETTAMLRVRALGCFFEVPASYTLIADPGDRLQFIAPGAAGSLTVEPYPSGMPQRLHELSSVTKGHLTIAEFTDHDPKEPVRLTVIQNGVQVVTLRRGARELADAITASCLANIHPRAPGSP